MSILKVLKHIYSHRTIAEELAKKKKKLSKDYDKELPGNKERKI